MTPDCPPRLRAAVAGAPWGGKERGGPDSPAPIPLPEGEGLTRSIKMVRVDIKRPTGLAGGFALFQLGDGGAEQFLHGGARGGFYQ